MEGEGERERKEKTRSPILLLEPETPNSERVLFLDLVRNLHKYTNLYEHGIVKGI